MIEPTQPQIPDYVVIFTEFIEGLIERTEDKLPHHTGIFIQAIETMLARHKPVNVVDDHGRQDVAHHVADDGSQWCHEC